MGYAKFVNGDAYFFAGAERVITNGSTRTSTSSLNRKPFKTWANGVSKPNRSVGDVIIPIDFENGGVQPVVRIYKVTGVTDSANGQVVTVGPDISTTSDIRSATNFVDLPDQGGGGVNAVPAFGFAELSINLSAIGINTSCPGLANGFVRSRSGGDPFSSELKDFVTPFPIDLNNCGRLRIKKHAGSNDGPALGGAEFDITRTRSRAARAPLHRRRQRRQ